MKPPNQIKKRLDQKLKQLKFEEEKGCFPTKRAVLTGEVISLEWVLGISKKKKRF